MFVETKEPSGPARNPNISPTPTLQSLAYVLRHKELWPTDFEWHYGYMYSCALGLAKRLWPNHDYRIQSRYTPDAYGATESFGIPTDICHQIFANALLNGLLPMSWVRPITVARRIERHLRKNV